MSLPQSNIDVSGGVEFVSQPSLTWYINKETSRIQNSVSGLAAVRQAVEATREPGRELEPLPFFILRGEDIYAPEYQKLLFPVTS